MAASTTSPTVLKWYFALELAKLRENAGFSPQQVAQRLGCSRPHIVALEKSRYLPKPAEVEVMLDFFGAAERTPSFLEFLEAARKGKDWWEAFKGPAPKWFDLFLGLEHSAGQNESYDGFVINGLFQTGDYAREVFRAGHPEADESEMARKVELRLARQDVLTRQPEPPVIWSVLDESALHRTAGSPKVMREQLRHLTKLAELPNITIQVLPMSKGPHAAVESGTFTILSLPDLIDAPAVAYQDGMVQGAYYEIPGDVQRFRNTLTRLQIDALNPSQSLTLINQRSEELS